jgi:hypothetical protein
MKNHIEASRQLFERDEATRVVELALKVIRCFQLGNLGADEPTYC